jgi:hypothetical protein
MSEERSSDENDTPLGRAQELVRLGELDRAFEMLASGADLLTTLNAHGKLADWLYNARKDPGSMLLCGNAGVRLGLEHAERRIASGDARDRDVESATQILANNIAANCWPGWGDEGVVSTSDHVRDGLALAQTSLSLLQSSNPTHEQLANAHWLIGALQFSAAESEAALTSFDIAEKAHIDAENRAGALMSRGYRFIVLKRSPSTAEAAAAELDAVVTALLEDGSNPARFFASQLRTADALL